MVQHSHHGLLVPSNNPDYPFLPLSRSHLSFSSQIPKTSLVHTWAPARSPPSLQDHPSSHPSAPIASPAPGTTKCLLFPLTPFGILTSYHYRALSFSKHSLQSHSPSGLPCLCCPFSQTLERSVWAHLLESVSSNSLLTPPPQGFWLHASNKSWFLSRLQWHLHF